MQNGNGMDIADENKIIDMTQTQYCGNSVILNDYEDNVM